MRVAWATRRPGGFAPAAIDLFDAVLPAFSAVVELKALRRFVETMLNTYVGEEPTRLILDGQVRRGDVRTITAALMLIDLRDFTLLSDRLGAARRDPAAQRVFRLRVSRGAPASRRDHGDHGRRGPGDLSPSANRRRGRGLPRGAERGAGGAGRDRRTQPPRAPRRARFCRPASRCITAPPPTAISAPATGSISPSSAPTSI